MLEEERLTTETEVQKGIFITLKQQYELAKIEEVEESATVQVLDEPVAPYKKSSPKVYLTLFLAMFIGLGSAIFIAIGMEGFDWLILLIHIIRYIMEKYINYRFKNLLNVAEDNKHRYLSSNPFPNIVLKDFFNPKMLEGVLREFPDLLKIKDSKRLGTKNEKISKKYR